MSLVIQIWDRFSVELRLGPNVVKSFPYTNCAIPVKHEQANNIKLAHHHAWGNVASPTIRRNLASSILLTTILCC